MTTVFVRTCETRDSGKSINNMKLNFMFQVNYPSSKFHKLFFWPSMIRLMTWISNSMQICLKEDAWIRMDVKFRPHFTSLMNGLITVKCKICILMDTKWHHIPFRKYIVNQLEYRYFCFIFFYLRQCTTVELSFEFAIANSNSPHCTSGEKIFS